MAEEKLVFAVKTDSEALQEIFDRLHGIGEMTEKMLLPLIQDLYL